MLGGIDYLSGYHLAELLRIKDEAASAWRRMLLQIRTLGYSVMVVRVDNDSVLLSASFRDVCNEFNVDIQRNAPYRHHQLARIERHWRTVADAVTALLTDAALAKSFWEERHNPRMTWPDRAALVRRAVTASATARQ